MRMAWLALPLIGGCLTIAGLDDDFVAAQSGAGGSAVASSTAADMAQGSGGNGMGGTPSSGGATSTGTGGVGGVGGVPGPACGDMNVDPDEQCDDGNTDALDGCSSTCTTEDPDDCASAPVIALGAQQVIVVSGDTSGADDDFQYNYGVGTCGYGPYPGSDHVYALIPQVSGNVTAELVANYDDHHLHIRDGCPGSQVLACDYSNYASTPDVVTLGVDMGVTYYLDVDSWSATAGSYTLTVTLN
jgi:cysteine-rich repeat protein